MLNYRILNLAVHYVTSGI